MITEDRDLTFWNAVYQHPEVKPHVDLGRELDLASILASPAVTPLRAEHGGFIFVGTGSSAELHTLFTPEGWGREVLQALKEAVSEMFARGFDVITTYDVEGHWRSRPPKTFRFEATGPFAPSDLGVFLRPWALTRAAWEASPARQRM